MAWGVYVLLKVTWLPSSISFSWPLFHGSSILSSMTIYVYMLVWSYGISEIEWENICTSNLVRHKLILIGGKEDHFIYLLLNRREFTLISRMTEYLPTNTKPEPKRISSWSIFPSPTVQCSEEYFGWWCLCPVSLLWESKISILWIICQGILYEGNMIEGKED